MSKLNRREALAYAICAAISATAFGVSAKMDEWGDGAVCAVLHPIDDAAALDCRVAALVR